MVTFRYLDTPWLIRLAEPEAQDDDERPQRDELQRIPIEDYLADRTLRRERARTEYEVARADAAEARQAAEQLLNACLTSAQRDCLARRDYFVVRATYPDGRVRRYRIERGYQNNVFEVDRIGRKLRVLCAHPANVPEADAMLAQKLLLEADPEAFERVANIRSIRAS